MAQRAEVIIYAISTDDSGLILRGDRTLEQIASATGGRAFFPFKMKDITHSFTAIEDELRSQYVVSYQPGGLRCRRPLPQHPDQRPEERPPSPRPQGLLRSPSVNHLLTSLSRLSPVCGAICHVLPSR